MKLYCHIAKYRKYIHLLYSPNPMFITDKNYSIGSIDLSSLYYDCNSHLHSEDSDDDKYFIIERKDIDENDITSIKKLVSSFVNEFTKINNEHDSDIRLANEKYEKSISDYLKSISTELIDKRLMRTK